MEAEVYYPATRCYAASMLELVYRKSAVKALARVPRGPRQKMLKALRAIARNPDGYRGDWKPLSGSSFWRLRMGGYRAICEIERERLVLLVLKVGPRGDIYK